MRMGTMYSSDADFTHFLIVFFSFSDCYATIHGEITVCVYFSATIMVNL